MAQIRTGGRDGCGTHSDPGFAEVYAAIHELARTYFEVCPPEIKA